MSTTLTEADKNALANTYRPLLVLYPEIQLGTYRPKNPRGPDFKRVGPPLKHGDYYPRDIKLILDNALLPGNRRTTPEQLLKAMSENEFNNKRLDHIDLIDSGGPKEVDKFWKRYAEKAHEKNDDGEEKYPITAYARVVEGVEVSERFKDYVSIQYWFPYFFDDWANVHEMDWEMVSIIIKKVGQIEEPIACIYNSHIGSFRKCWHDMQKAIDPRYDKQKAIEQKNKEPIKDDKGLHPIVYVASGSHASYFSDYPSDFVWGEHFLKHLRPVLRKMTEMIGEVKLAKDFVPSFEKGEKRFPEIKVIPEPDEEAQDSSWEDENSPRWKWYDDDWKWLNFQGSWGSPVQWGPIGKLLVNIRVIGFIYKLVLYKWLKKLPLREAAPKGPTTYTWNECWNDPFNWLNLTGTDALKTLDWLCGINGADANSL